MYGNASSVPQTRRDPSRWIAIAVVAVVLGAAVASVVTASGSATTFFPKHWDAQVAPIAAEVASLRGLAFDHPVRIRYLEPKVFEKQLQGQGGGPTASDRAEITRQEAVFRSLGLIGGKVDLYKDSQTESSSDTLAYYDFDSKEIFVRGTTLDVAHRVTVAHELTHVLQDQHFDLQKLEKRANDSEATDEGGLRAIFEGDAVRVQQDYLKQLSAADQKAYATENSSEGSRVGQETSSVADIIDVLQTAPYEFGPSAVRVLLKSGGEDAVNSALTGPPPSSGVMVAAGDVTPPITVEPPALPAGTQAVGKPEPFGPFETFLTLAMKIEPVRALASADSLVGGKAVTYRRGTQTCYRIALEPDAASAATYMLHAFTDWAKGRTGATVRMTGPRVELTVCDPGKSAPVPDAKPLHEAINVLLFRSSVTEGLSTPKIPAALSRCVARAVIQEPGAVKLIDSIGEGDLTDAQGAALRQLIQPAVLACRDDPETGLP